MTAKEQNIGNDYKCCLIIEDNLLALLVIFHKALWGQSVICILVFPLEKIRFTMAGVAQWIKSDGLQTERMLVWFPIRAHTWDVGQVPG